MSRDLSAGKGEGGGTQASGSSRAAAHNQTRRESNSHNNEEQEGQLSRPIVRSQSRRGTDQSELRTPLPIYPAQVDPDQLPGWASKSHPNLLDDLGGNDVSRENFEETHVNSSRSHESFAFMNPCR